MYRSRNPTAIESGALEDLLIIPPYAHNGGEDRLLPAASRLASSPVAEPFKAGSFIPILAEIPMHK